MRHGQIRSVRDVLASTLGRASCSNERYGARTAQEELTTGCAAAIDQAHVHKIAVTRMRDGPAGAGTAEQ
jgi:hypothetical protein